jgi:hypothetical protein
MPSGMLTSGGRGTAGSGYGATIQRAFVPMLVPATITGTRIPGYRLKYVPVLIITEQGENSDSSDTDAADNAEGGDSEEVPSEQAPPAPYVTPMRGPGIPYSIRIVSQMPSGDGSHDLVTYQTIDAYGNDVTGSFQSLIEHVSPIFGPLGRTSNDTPERMYHGQVTDLVGYNRIPDQPDTVALRIQQFEVQYGDQTYRLTTEFWHLTIVQSGVVTTNFSGMVRP